jgi:hypothetical protein
MRLNAASNGPVSLRQLRTPDLTLQHAKLVA